MRKVDLRGKKLFIHRVIEGISFLDIGDRSLMLFSKPGEDVFVLEMGQWEARQFALELQEAETLTRDDAVIDGMEQTL